MTSETESMSNAGGATPGDRPKRRSVGTLFLDNTNTLARFNSYANLAEENGVMRAGADDLFGDDDGYNWGTLFEAPSETEKFAAIESLFDASGVDLRAIKGAGPEVFQGEPGVTFVRLDGGRNLVLFAPVSATPSPRSRRRPPRNRRNSRSSSRTRACTAARRRTFETPPPRSSAVNISRGPSPRPPARRRHPPRRRRGSSALRLCAHRRRRSPAGPGGLRRRARRARISRARRCRGIASRPRGGVQGGLRRAWILAARRGRRWRWSAWQTSRWSASA